jgi:hypothetical protein
MKTLPSSNSRILAKRFALCLAAGAAVLFGVGAATVHAADLITPVAATAQSFYAPDNRAPINAINGSGMTPSNPVVPSSTCGNTPANTMWLSNNTQSTWITFDLGVSEPIGGFRLWNYNEVNSPFQGRGVKTAGIYAGNSLLASGTAYASAGPAWGTLVENMTFAIANGTTTNPGVDYIFASPVTTRYLQIYVTGNFGPPSDNYTGISEIRFIPANLPGTIRRFGTNVALSSAIISPVVANAATIAWTVPFGTNLATLAPTYLLADGATCPQPNDGTTPPTPNFSTGPVPYSVTDTATSTTNVYTVSAVVGPPSTARDITAFNANFPGSSSGIFNTSPNTGTIVVYLPPGSPAAIASTLAPSFTMSAGATANQTSGSRPTPNLSMSSPVTYTVTAQDGISTKDYTVRVQRTGWAQVPWTGDADSGIGGTQADYTVAVNMGTADTVAATVNGITFSAHTMSGPNFVLTGTSTNAGRAATNVTGDSDLLAKNFTHGSNRVLTLSNLTPGTTYQTSFYTYGWDAAPGRTQRFDTDGDIFIGDGSAYGDGNGARIFYTFVAGSSGSKVLNVTQTGIGPFHISALGNRIAPPPTPPTGDTDGDDLADTWELEKTASGGNPGNLTDLTGLLTGPGPGAGTGDFDNDGLIDAQEYVLRLTYPTVDPLDADSDNDGLTDGAEVFPTAPRAASNPTLADTDGDGLSDLVEDNSGTYGGLASPGTSAASADSDGDQYPDGYEIAQSGHPLNATVIATVLPAGITLGVVTDEASTGISTEETFTHKISGGSAATVNGVALDVLDTAATPPNFAWDGRAGGKNIIGPGINNGTWNPDAGNVANVTGLRQMLGTFTYSGLGAAPGNSQQFTLSALEPGLTYELRLFIRKWDNGTVRPASLKFTNGAQVTSFYILEDRPGTVLGNGNDDSAYYISYTYVAQSATLSIETTVPAVSTGNGSFHMYGLTNREASEPKPLDFTSIVREPDGSSIELTWNSRPGRLYKVEFATDLQTWIELTDAHPSGGTSTTYEDSVASNLPRAQYRVTEVPAAP